MSVERHGDVFGAAVVAEASGGDKRPRGRLDRLRSEHPALQETHLGRQKLGLVL